jgi:short-subunit dehydrogenase
LSIVCDISDILSVKRAAQQIVELNLTIGGLLNNAGIMPQKATKSVQVNKRFAIGTAYLQ